MANKSSKRAAVSLRIRPIPGEAPPNFYYPTGQFTKTLYNEVYDWVVLFLMKIDPDKPFGDFYIDTLIKPEMDSLATYEHENPMYIDNNDPDVITYKFSSPKKDSSVHREGRHTDGMDEKGHKDESEAEVMESTTTFATGTTTMDPQDTTEGGDDEDPSKESGDAPDHLKYTDNDTN